MNGSIQSVDVWKLFVDDQKHRLKIDIENLAQSILTTGQINPITVVKDGSEFRVIAGRRRFAALTYIQEELRPKEKIKALVMVTSLNELQQEMITIDENIMRQQLSGAEFDEAVYRRKQIYEELNPETRQHTSGAHAKNAKESGKKKPAKAFAHDAAKKLDVSRRTIEKAVARAAKASEAVKKARESGKISPSKVDLLVMLNPREQDILLPLVTMRDVAETKLLIEQAKKRGARAVHHLLHEQVPEYSELKKLAKEVDELSKKLSDLIRRETIFKGPERWQDIKSFDTLSKELSRFINFQKSKMGHVKAITRRGDSRREILEAFRG